VGLRAGLDRCAKFRPPPPTGIRSPDRPVAIPTELPGPRRCSTEMKWEVIRTKGTMKIVYRSDDDFYGVLMYESSVYCGLG